METIENAAPVAPLTPREWEVLHLLSTGLANRVIGERLYVSERTIRTHVEHILSKLGVGSRVEAAVWLARSAPTALIASIEAMTEESRHSIYLIQGKDIYCVETVCRRLP